MESVCCQAQNTQKFSGDHTTAINKIRRTILRTSEMRQKRPPDPAAILFHRKKSKSAPNAAAVSKGEFKNELICTRHNPKIRYVGM